MIHRKSQILHPATGKPCPDIVRFTQATDDHTVRCAGMDKLTIFQIDPDMVRHFFLPLPVRKKTRSPSFRLARLTSCNYASAYQPKNVPTAFHRLHETQLPQNRNNPLLSLSIHPSDEGRQAIWLLHCIKIYYRSESGGHHRDGKAPSVP